MRAPRCRTKCFASACEGASVEELLDLSEEEFAELMVEKKLGVLQRKRLKAQHVAERACRAQNGVPQLVLGTPISRESTMVADGSIASK